MPDGIVATDLEGMKSLCSWVRYLGCYRYLDLCVLVEPRGWGAYRGLGTKLGCREGVPCGVVLREDNSPKGG